MNRTSSAQIAPLIVLIVVILGVGLYVNDKGVNTDVKAVTDQEATATTSDVSTTSEIITEPLVLGEAVPNELMGIALQVPEGWSSDVSNPQVYTLLDPNNPNNQIQVLLGTAEDIGQGVFGLPVLPEDLSPTSLLSAFETDVLPQNEGLVVEHPIEDKTIGELVGSSITVKQTEGDAFIGVNLLQVPNDGRYLATLLVTSSGSFDGLDATLDTILASAEIGPAPVAQAPTEVVVPTAEVTEVATEEVATEEATLEPTVEVTEEATEEVATEVVEPTEVAVEPTTVPTEAPTEVAVESTAVPTEEPTVEPTEEATAEPTVEPTAVPTEEPAAEPLAIEEEPYADEDLGLTVGIPEGFEARSREPFVYLEKDDVSIRFLVADVKTVASQSLGLELETVPNNNISVNLLRTFGDNSEENFDLVSGLTVTMSGKQAYIDLTREGKKHRIVLRELADGRLLFVEAVAPLENFEEVAATVNVLLDDIEIAETE